MKNLVSLVILTALVSGCGNKKDGGGGSSPAAPAMTKPATETAAPETVVTPPPGKKEEPAKKNPNADLKRVIQPINSGNDAGTGPVEEPNAGLELTGAQAAPNMDYVSLKSDGLMTTLQKYMSFEGAAQLNRNQQLAAQIVNGKLLYDLVTGDKSVVIKIKEGKHVRNYTFSVSPIEDKLAPMVRARTNAYNEGRQNLKASFMCVDATPDCNVAVVKLEHPKHKGAKGAKAYAMITFRREVADIHFSMSTKETKNADLAKIDQFFMNSRIIYDGADQLLSAQLESFEVAYGVSLVRTLIFGRDSEIVAHAGSLVASRGSVNWKMRPLQRESEDIDLYDLEGRTTYMASTIGTATLRKVEAQGKVTVTYRMKTQTEGGQDEFVLAYKTKPITLKPIDYLSIK